MPSSSAWRVESERSFPSSFTPGMTTLLSAKASARSPRRLFFSAVERSSVRQYETTFSLVSPAPPPIPMETGSAAPIVDCGCM